MTPQAEDRTSEDRSKFVLDLVCHVNAAHNLALELDEVFATGETRSAHLVHDPDGREWILKWVQATAGSEANLLRLVRTVDGLRQRGYPAPEHTAVGVVGPVAYWIQARLPGEPLFGPGKPPAADALLHRLTPDLLELIALHADRGDCERSGDPRWPASIIQTLETGGDGYCLHETMLQRSETAQMLATIKRIATLCRDVPCRQSDIVHFDFSYANVLSDGSAVTGIIDWNGPFVGDHAFDIATLLFYAYKRPPTRDLLWAALLDRADARAAALYLSHLTLRQVEWTARFYTESPMLDHFVALGQDVLDDVTDAIA